jgi:hypothetical protein
MTPTREEIVYRVFGASLLARFDARGMEYFDESPEAALRSFFAAALVAPAFIVISLLSLTGSATKTDQAAFFVMLVFALYYTLLWVVSPVIVYRVCQVIGRETAFFRFLSANNWASVITLHLSMVVAILRSTGIVPEALASLLILAVFGYVLAYQWFIARHGLDVSPLGAVGFVALQFVIHFMIESIIVGLVFQSAG